MCDQTQLAIVALLVFAIVVMYTHGQSIKSNLEGIFITNPNYSERNKPPPGHLGEWIPPMVKVDPREGVFGVPAREMIDGQQIKETYECDRWNSTTAFPQTWRG
jgi:hypothetical protein